MSFIYKKIIRRILFKFEPEISHILVLKLLNVLNKLYLTRFICSKNLFIKNERIEIAGLCFKNRVGIAAGLDKNAEYIDALADFGFGFIEVGTVTPRPQVGNPKPRLFRLEKNEAIINRMGFNNYGTDKLINNIKSSKLFKKKQSIKNQDLLALLGINIGKNFDTPNQSAIDDYIICMEDIYQYADYVTINISSPNTQNLRDLQKGEFLEEFLKKIKIKQVELAAKNGKYKPIALKISPDLTDSEIKTICNLCYINSIDLLIISNTSNNHELLFDKNNNKIQGGLSGKPILEKSNHVLSVAKKYLNEIHSTIVESDSTSHKVYIIGVGGINTVDDAKNKIQCGADLIQVYTGLIYQGSKLVQDIIKEL